MTVKYIGFLSVLCGIINATEINFNVEIFPSQLSLVPKDTFTFVSIGGFEYENTPGAPMLPVVSKKFCVPTNEAVISFDIIAIDSVVISGEYLVYPVQPPEPMQMGVFYPPDTAIYNSFNPFPDEIVKSSSSHYMAGVKLTDVLVYPVRYRPALRKLVLYTHLEVKLVLGLSPSIAYPVVRRSLKQHQDILNSAKMIVDNPEQVEVFTISPPIVLDSLFAPWPWPGGPWTFIIITNQAMADEFQILANWRIDKGWRTRVIKKEWIEDNYPGRDIQEKIREYIKYAYSELGTQYVLIGGDEEIIPTRIAYTGIVIEDPQNKYNYVPSDLYYSDLEGYWDGDWEGMGPAADNVFCNFADQQLPPPMYLDSVDFTPDVAVGRLPVSTEVEAVSLINKLLIYEQTPGQEYSSIAYFLLLGSNMSGQTWQCSGGEIKDSCVADISPVISVFGLYDDVYAGTTPHIRIGRQACIDYINQGFYLINHAGHGDQCGIFVAPDAPFSEYLGCSDIQYLLNAPQWSSMYSTSCLSADFSVSPGDCFGESIVTPYNGGVISYLGHTKVGWYAPSAPGTTATDILDRYFQEILTRCEHPRRGTNIVGLALSLAKSMLPHPMPYTLHRYELVSLNDLADPTTPVWICRPGILIASHIETIPVNRWVDVTVKVTNGSGLPLPDAVVCLNKVGDIYEVKTTNPSGEATFHIYARTTGTINVTASKTMYIPSRTSISVRGGLWTDDSLALAYNGNRHLARKPNSEGFHLVYTDQGKVIYRYSSDCGQHWTESFVIGEGGSPAISLDSQDLPSIVWTSSPGAGNLYYRRQLPTGEWSPIDTIFYSLLWVNVGWHSMIITNHPEIPEDTVHILVHLYKLANGMGNSIVEFKFPISNPGEVTNLVLEGWWYPPTPSGPWLNHPCITWGAFDTLHAVWEHDNEIYYATRRIGHRWRSWGHQFGLAGFQSAHPFIECYGDSVFVVWQHKEPPTMQEEIYRASRHLTENYTWNDLSRTPNTPSIFPVNAGGPFTVFADLPFAGANNWFEIYYKIRPEDRLFNISQSPDVLSLCPHSAVRYVPGGDYLYVIWMEGSRIPYEIQFETIRFIGIEIAYLTSPNGYETPSPYLIQRDSFIPDWQIPVDIGYETITYQFPLAPGYRYRIKVIAYHESSGQWREWVRIDNGPRHLVKYNAYQPETLEFWIPPAFYQDGSVDMVFDRISGSFATAGPIYIYQYEYEEESTELASGPMAQGNKSLSIGEITVFPNLFKEKVEIRLSTENVGQGFSLAVYDVTGRLVRDFSRLTVIPDLIRDERSTVVWDGCDDLGRRLPSGVYFVRLEAGDFKKVEKVILLR